MTDEPRRWGEPLLDALRRQRGEEPPRTRDRVIEQARSEAQALHRTLREIESWEFISDRLLERCLDTRLAIVRWLNVTARFK